MTILIAYKPTRFRVDIVSYKACLKFIHLVIFLIDITDSLLFILQVYLGFLKVRYPNNAKKVILLIFWNKILRN